MARKAVPENVQSAVLLKSRRRCCICFGLNRDTSLKQGQIAHLDRNPVNNLEDNLAFLCFDHHDQYDSTTRQSKSFTKEEVKHFRYELLSNITLAFGTPVSFGNANTTTPDVSGHYVRESSNESAELRIHRIGDGRYHVSGLALWGTKGDYGPNIGELDFISELIDGEIEYSEASFRDLNYSAKLQFQNGRLLVLEKNRDGKFGMNVGYEGEYANAT